MSDLRTALTGIYQRRGELSPHVVVDEARPADSPLHDRFEWDNEIAGEAYRLVQAAELIRSVRIVYQDNPTGETKSVRAFHSLREAGSERKGYAPIDEIITDELATKILLQEFLRKAAELKARYGHLVQYIEWIRAEAMGGDVA